MFAKLLSPSSLASEALDDYLENGWFRMGQSIFTTHFLHFHHQFYSALWLRIDLNKPIEDSRRQKLFKQNASFRVSIQEASLTPEKEELYTRYKQAVPFEASESLHNLLHRQTDHTIFHTREVTLYDGEKLIALGFFDVGATSAAGIVSVYDPSYRKHSLGKYLIYLKLEDCQKRGLSYFYPGYFAPGYKAFDYKLDICTPQLEYFELESYSWQSLAHFSLTTSPLCVMQRRLIELETLLSDVQIRSTILFYDYFDANLIPNLRSFELFDFPLFLSYQSSDHTAHPIIVYDVRDMRYHLLQCHRVWTPDEPTKIEGHYGAHLLKTRYYLFSSESPEELAAVVIATSNSQVEN